MTPLMLRQLWSLVERTQANILLNLDDASLVQWLIRQFKTERSLDHSEATIISAYIYSHVTLIRDIAEER
jgi:hypothetical protein